MSVTGPRSRRSRRHKALDPFAVLGRLAAIRGRAAGSDAERRAARMLADELRATGRTATVETVWVRSRWTLALALATVLAVAGSMISITQPEIGLGVALAALVAALLDLGGRLPAFRRLTGARATQNVVSPAPDRRQVTLMITAAVDSPRGGTCRSVDVWLGGRGTVVLLVALVGVVATAVLRVDGNDAQWVAGVQIVPTILLLLATAALVETARVPPLEGSNAASGPAAVLALASRLDARPPRNLAMEVVLAGAGDSGGALGLAAHIARRRKELGSEEVAVLHVEPCASGAPCWWIGDGLIARLHLHPQLVSAAERAAEAEAHLEALRYRGRGATGALAARRVRWPAIAVGAATPADPARQDADPAALRATVDFAAALVATLDGDLEARAQQGPDTKRTWKRPRLPWSLPARTWPGRRRKRGRQSSA